MVNFEYPEKDLAQDSIRLLQIRKGCWAEDLSCSLVESLPDPEKGIPYKALSYTWGGVKHTAGGPEKLPRVWVNGHEFNKSQLTDNLFSALRHIRRVDQDVLLWADAICINQSNEVEKGHQVKQMGAIYAAAEEVLVWLGPGNDDTKALMHSITLIDAEASKTIGSQGGISGEDWTGLCRRFMIKLLGSLGSQPHLRHGQAMAGLLSSKWFERIWILQEVAMAKTARIICGLSSCPARTFGLMPMLMGIDVDERTQAILDIMPRVRKNTWWSSKRYLHHLLVKFSASQASVGRDKIYALLSMSEDAHDPTRFFPCYEKSEDQVFRDTACFLILGEILDLNHSFPNFKVSELSLPIIHLAEKALSWALTRGGRLQDSARRTAVILVNRLKEGQLKTQDLLLSLAKEHGQLREMQRLLPHGNVDLDLILGDEQNILRISSHGRTKEMVDLVFPSDHSSRGKSTDMKPPPPFRFTEEENMVDTIKRLMESGSPKEELLWANSWAGNVEPIQKLLKEGVDVDSPDDQGHTSLHYATQQGHVDVVSLLLEKGADVNWTDKKGNTALNLAVTRALR
ncbi:hypothetical protein CEP51_003329 [Fusarium floridanum]|uniref:Heterokaryon incompatibility domain-containing protein n=1 Tax=Fusarium floridanum TaxID=1325733 RepID=A0A428S6P4_9HYPO|nr:hypothetical protein CEP51_003329 [Fusarium floridanum]